MRKFLQLLCLAWIIPLFTIGQSADDFYKALPEERLFEVGSSFGRSIAMDENLAVIASYHGSNEEGMAYVYEKTADQWEMIAQLKIPGENPPKHSCQQVYIAGDDIVLANREVVYLYEKPIGGWTDMTATDKFEKDDYYKEFTVHVSDDHIVLSFNPGVDGIAVCGWEMKDHVWQKFDYGQTWLGLMNAAKDSIQFLAPQYNDFEVINYTEDEWDHPSFTYDIPKVQDFIVKDNCLLLKCYPTDTLYLYQKEEGALWTADLIPLKFYPQNTEEWIVTMEFDLSSDLISCRYKNSEGNSSVFCFEKAGDEWTSMTETAVIPLEEGLNINWEKMFAHNAYGLFYTKRMANNDDYNTVMIYSKAGENWSDELVQSSLAYEGEGELTCAKAEFGFAMSSYEKHTVIFDRGKSANLHAGRVMVYEDQEDGSIIKIATLDYEGEEQVVFEGVEMFGNTIAISAQTLDDNKRVILIYEKPEAGWADANQTAILKRDIDGESFKWNDLLSIKMNQECILISQENDLDWYSYFRPDGGWVNKTQNQVISMPNESKQAVALGQDILTYTDDNNINLFALENQQWKNESFAQLNYRNAITSDLDFVLGNLQLEDDKLFLGLKFIPKDEKMEAGKVFAYEKKGDEWNSQDAPMSIIKSPYTGNIIGDFGNRFIVCGNFLLTQVGWTKKLEYPEPQGYVRAGQVFIYELNEDLQPIKKARIRPGAVGTSTFGNHLSINPDRILISHMFNKQLAYHSGAVFSLPIDKIQFQTVGIPEVLGTKNIQVYPNPLQDQLTISLEEEDEYVLNIYNIQGAMMASYAFNGKEFKCPTHDLSRGSYIIQLISDEKVESFKVIK